LLEGSSGSEDDVDDRWGAEDAATISALISDDKEGDDGENDCGGFTDTVTIVGTDRDGIIRCFFFFVLNMVAESWYGCMEMR